LNFKDIQFQIIFQSFQQRILKKACHQAAAGAKDLIKTFRANLFDVLALEKKGIQNMIQKSYDSITLVYLD